MEPVTERQVENQSHPLAEVFGFRITDQSDKAARHRRDQLCPFNNRVASCTKDKAKNPLGVCLVHDGDAVVCTCPIRFREDWLIASDAAEFLFKPGAKWTTLTEVRLQDADGKSAGNIDLILAAYDDAGKVVNFGAMEVQAVYISGNVRNPFNAYMASQARAQEFDWSGQPNYPRPDYLSSSRKRLAPQLLFKGGILHAWGKRLAIALDESFFATLPPMPEVLREKADLAWFVYSFKLIRGRYRLTLTKVVYTPFVDSLQALTTSKPGRMEDFMSVIQSKLDEKLENPPTTEHLESLK